MDILEICASTTNWVDSAHDTDYWKSPCEFGIDPPSWISHIVMCIRLRPKFLIEGVDIIDVVRLSI